jgi:YidC/Oxa1 family membrane protein insertase
MEEFNFKRMMMAFLLCMAIMYGWMFLTGKFRQPPPSQQPTTPASAPIPAVPAAPAAATPGSSGAAPLSQTVSGWRILPVESIPAEISVGDRNNVPGGYKALIQFDLFNASVSGVLLGEHKYKITDKEYGYPLLAEVTDRNGRVFSTLMLGELRLAGHPEKFDLSRDCWKRQDDSPQADGAESCRFVAQLVDAQDHPVLEIIKTYRYSRNSYDLQFELSFVNHSDRPLQVESLELFGPVGIIREDFQRDSDREIIAAYTVGDSQVSTVRETLASIASKPQKAELTIPSSAQSLLWFGQANKYFASVLYPEPRPETKRVDYLAHGQVTAAGYSFRDRLNPDDQPQPLGVKTTFAMPAPLPAGEKTAYSFGLYLGAIDKRLFDNPIYPQYAQLHFEKLINVTWCAFEFLNSLLLKIMNGVYLVVGNYGVAVIILVLLVRVILHPITKKSQVSMMKMTKLGPQIEEIKRKYAGNQQEIQKHTMAIYKQQGATPILGCLPMLLQMPIWVALYSAVSNNVALRHQGLFPPSWHWLNDLSAPDRLIPFSVFGLNHPIQIPLMGGVDAVNLLPILLAVAIFLQTKFSPQSAMTQQTPQMQQQQKMMLYMMPVMMLVFLYGGPSGLNLYIMASTFCGLIEQHIIRKHIQEQQAKEAAVTVESTKKIKFGFGPKKKKPKPPIKFNT